MRRIFSLSLAAVLIAVAVSPNSRAVMSPNKKQKALERVRYSEFAGKQQDWPLTQQAMIDIQATKYGVSIYYNLPNKPYEILGTFQATGDSVIKRAAEAAEAVGADAILVVKNKAFSDAGIEINAEASARGSNTGKLKLLEGILIRWKREAAPPAPAPTPPVDTAH
jgi:hypothetical protein